MISKLVFIIVFLISVPVLAEDKIPDAYRTTGYALPRFASLASEKVYVRAGPGMKYPVLWVFEQEGYPVEITLEFDHWRKIRDHEGQEGWVHASLLSGKRSAFVTGDAELPLKAAAGEGAAVTVMLKPGVIATLERCEDEYCRLKTSGYRGWAERKSFWGVYPGENID